MSRILFILPFIFLTACSDGSGTDENVSTSSSEDPDTEVESAPEPPEKLDTWVIMESGDYELKGRDIIYVNTPNLTIDLIHSDFVKLIVKSDGNFITIPNDTIIVEDSGKDNYIKPPTSN